MKRRDERMTTTNPCGPPVLLTTSSETHPWRSKKCGESVNQEVVEGGLPASPAAPLSQQDRLNGVKGTGKIKEHDSHTAACFYAGEEEELAEAGKTMSSSTLS